jgi:hypothetical protein
VTDRLAPRARWVVLTPSADDAAWRQAISKAAAIANVRLVDPEGQSTVVDYDDVVFLTDDAAIALEAENPEIVAIMPDPESAPDAVASRYGIEPPNDGWHASLLLARAYSLRHEHAVVTASDLSYPLRSLRLFGILEVIPPESTAEASRRRALATALEIYRRRGNTDSMIAWSERLFIFDDKGVSAQEEWGLLDVTGRPRILVWGPYIALPKGLWQAVIRFAVDADAARHTYRLDWGTQTECVSTYVTPSRPGVYEASLDWRFVEAALSEIRIILTEGSIGGSLMFQGIKVSHITDEMNADDVGATRHR